MAEQHLSRVTGLRGSKTDIEAFNGTLDLMGLAYATDTDELGIYFNGSWHWISAGEPGKYRQFVYVVESGAPKFVVDDDGYLVTTLLPLE